MLSLEQIRRAIRLYGKDLVKARLAYRAAPDDSIWLYGEKRFREGLFLAAVRSYWEAYKFGEKTNAV